MDITIELTPEELALAERYAQEHAVSLEDAFKEALLERIEDEYYSAVADEAYSEFSESGYQSKPISELWAELNL